MIDIMGYLMIFMDIHELEIQEKKMEEMERIYNIMGYDGMFHQIEHLGSS